MPEIDDRLSRIATQLSQGEEPEDVTARTFIGWFGAQRRSYWNVVRIRVALAKYKLLTEPDFEFAYIDSLIGFAVEEPGASSSAPETAENVDLPSPTLAIEPLTDPTYRIGKLAAANKELVRVHPNAPLREAITLMLSNDYFQLPVMQDEREVKGIISWATIGKRLALGQTCDVVRDCMDEHYEISSNESLFSAIDGIVKHEYALIRDSDRRISGLVTTSDLSRQFHAMGEPFLVLGQIENFLRQIIERRFSAEELLTIIDHQSEGPKIESVHSLSFGDYVYVLENPERWEKVKLPIDRVVFVKTLDKVRTIRNDVMHFDPDGIDPSALGQLRDFLSMLQELRLLKII